MFPAVLQTLAMLSVFAIIVTPTTTQVDALPITSKPIESTAENLAWQAWIMMPPHQQNLEKSRKVTPKSIFILPNRVQMPAPVGGIGEAQPWVGEPGSGSGLYAPIECPPGQRQFESRCISTLDIDRDQLVIQELQVLLQQGSGSTNNNSNNNSNINIYDYDYDYDEESAAPLVINDPPLIFKSSELPSSIAVSNGNYEEGLGLPHQDSPLKFNIFKANFPTNTDSEPNQTQAVHSEKRVANNPNEAQFLLELKMTNATEALVFEGQKMSGNSSAISNSTGSSNSTTSNGEPNRFSLGAIDAIILPAASSLARPHHVSILKNHSIVQLVPSAVDHRGRGDAIATATAATTTAIAKKQVHLGIVELLKVDSLLPLHSSSKAATSSTATTTVKSTNATPPPPPTVQTTTNAATIEGLTTTETLTVTPIPLPTTTTSGLTTPLLTASESSENEEQTKPTPMPTPLATLLDEVDRNQSEDQEKGERTRSVTLSSSSDKTDTIEPETTLDSVPPTTFVPSSSSESSASTFDHLDETTVTEREMEAAEEVAVQHSHEPEKSKQHTELKKSKVEPVEELPANRKHFSNDDDDLLASQATPLPTLRDTITQHQGADDARTDHEQVGDNGQFYYREDQLEMEVASEDGNLRRRQKVGAGLALKQTPKSTAATQTITTSTAKAPASTIVTTTNTPTPSEIDIAAELRAINELVKSRRQAAEAINKKRIPTAAAAVTATTAAIVTAAVTATPTTKSTLANSQIVKSSLVSDQDGSTSVTTPTKTTETTTKPTATTTPTTTTTIATTRTVIVSTETTPSVAGADVDADTIEESANATTATTTTTTTSDGLASSLSSTATTDEEATATLWSKVMPMLGLGATKTAPQTETTKRGEERPQTSEITTPLTTTSTIAATATKATTTPTPTATKATPKSFKKSLTKSFKNSQNQNTEITRSRLDLPKLAAYSFLSDNAKTTTTTTTPTLTTTTTSESSSLLSAASSLFPTRVPPPSDGSSSAYWWFPIGWRLDPPTPTPTPSSASISTNNEHDSSVAQPQSLLLRFWSAFPGNQVKVRK